MPTIRTPPDFRSRYWKENGPVFIPLVISLPLFVLNGDEKGFWFWIGLVLFLGSLTWMLVLHRKWFHHFDCPECYRSLPVPKRKPHEPIRFECTNCDIIWDTGFKEPGDD